MNNWKTYRISELGSVNRGKSKHRPRNDKMLYGGKYPFIQTADVKEANFYINKHSATYNNVGLAQSKLWEKGTLCITIAANIADTAILSYSACFPDSIVGFKAYEDISDVRFVKYYFDIYKKHMESISMGATQNNLSIKKLESLKFIFPNLKTQQKIANILSTYDELIETNNRRIEILEKIDEEIYKEWFVRMRFPGYENTEFEKGIPKGWEVKKVLDLVNRLKAGHFYKEKELSEKGEVIVIDQSEKKFMGYHDNEPTHKSSIDNPIILFGDHSCKMLIMTRPFSLGENIIPFIPNSDNSEIFLYYSLKRLIKTEEYKRHWKELMSKKIFYPQSELQERFNNTIKNNISIIEKYKTQNQNLIKQRDLLLPRLMNGTIEVK